MAQNAITLKRETLAKFLPDHKTIRQFEDLILAVNSSDINSTQNFTGTGTIAADKVFCIGSGYTIFTPEFPDTGDEVVIFNIETSGFITISTINGVDFDLYNGETLEITFDGSEWQA